MIKILFLFVMIFFLEVVALYGIKKATLVESNNFLFLSMACYATIPVFLYVIVKKIPLALTNAAWNVASTVYGILIGILIFGEIVSVRQWIGLGLGAIGFGLMTSVATSKT